MVVGGEGIWEARELRVLATEFRCCRKWVLLEFSQIFISVPLLTCPNLSSSTLEISLLLWPYQILMVCLKWDAGYLLNQLLTQPCLFAANTTDVPEFPSRNGPQRLVAAATRQPKRREKVVLEPGHSPLDWARLTMSGKDLRVSSLYVRTQYIDLFSLTLVIT
jgi:hypothetical protein